MLQAHYHRFGLLLLVFSSSLPFIHQAFHIDDRIYLEISENILKNPLFPYDYSPIFEGLIRGSIIGIIFIKFMKWFRKGGSWWMFPMQLYLTVWIYQSVRDTTFRFIVDISQNVLPAIIVLVVLRSLLLVSKLNNKFSLGFNR